MGRSTFSLFLLVVVVGSVFAFPPQKNKYDNIPQCMQPAETGLCLAYFQSWFYNPSSGKCESFIYGGCGGNGNRFPSEQDCMKQCGNFKPENKEFKLILETVEAHPASQKLTENDDQQIGNIREICTLKSEMGPCRGMMKRFYFNGEICEEFLFGGCHGNGNNFKSMEECKQKCESNSEDKGNEESAAAIQER